MSKKQVEKLINKIDVENKFDEKSWERKSSYYMETFEAE